MEPRVEHQLISTAIITGNEHQLIARYGSKAAAEHRLMELEYFLNYGIQMEVSQ